MGENGSKGNIGQELELAKQQGANLLMPSTAIEGLSEFHGVVLEKVLLSANPNDGDVYPHDNDGKKFRPTKQALMKLSVCAGVIWSPTESKRIDNGADRNYIAYKAVGGLKKADGQPVFFSAEYDIDFEVMEEELRDQYERKAKSYKDKSDRERVEYVDYCVKRDLLQKRKFKLRLCEAGAMNRVLRMLLGIKQAYTVAELAKPFVMARIVFRPDFTDASVKQQFIDASIKSMIGIYGPGAAAAMPENSKPIDVTPCPRDEDEKPEEPENGKAAEQQGGQDPAPPVKEAAIANFEAYGVAEQVEILKKTSLLKRYDLDGYVKRNKGESPETWLPAKRADLYRHLLTMPDADIPF